MEESTIAIIALTVFVSLIVFIARHDMNTVSIKSSIPKYENPPPPPTVSKRVHRSKDEFINDFIELHGAGFSQPNKDKTTTPPGSNVKSIIDQYHEDVNNMITERAAMDPQCQSQLLANISLMLIQLDDVNKYRIRNRLNPIKITYSEATKIHGINHNGYDNTK